MRNCVSDGGSSRHRKMNVRGYRSIELIQAGFMLKSFVLCFQYAKFYYKLFFIMRLGFFAVSTGCKSRHPSKLLSGANIQNNRRELTFFHLIWKFCSKTTNFPNV